MSLRDHEPSSSTPGRRYRIDEILDDELPEDDAEALRGWLRDLRFSPEAITRELDREGISVVPGSIARYRYEKLGLGDRRR